MRRHALFVPLFVALAGAAFANDPEPRVEKIDWGATFIGQYFFIAGDRRDEDRGEFFDRYQWTANKDSAFPVEIGIRDGYLDLVGANDTPLLQARYASPTSNLGISGSQIDEPFFNQHLDVLARERGISLDLEYDRIRTEQLRRFPNTAGAGLLFDDRSDPNDRFFRDRTGIAGELRVRPDLVTSIGSLGERLAPRLTLRGGYESRGGNRQLLLHRDPSNEWLGLTQDNERSVWDVGTGLSLRPHERVRVDVDYDYERFRFEGSRWLEQDLGYALPAGNRTIGFVPDSERQTVSIGLRSRLTQNAHLRAGFRYGEFQQISPFTPVERSAGLNDNRIRSLAANAGVRVALLPDLSLDAELKYDQRDNDIDRSTVAFASDNGTQVDPFLARVDHVVARVELDKRFGRRGSVGLGVRYDGILRDLDFSTGPPPRILARNAWIADDTQTIGVTLRGRLRPVKGAKLAAEIGYRAAPETGYLTELDDVVEGALRGSYVVAFERPIILTGSVRGMRGENRDFEATSGIGPDPAGPTLRRHFERSSVGGGIGVSHSPIENLALHASFYGARNEQQTGLDLSTLQRTVQDVAPVSFRNAGDNRYHDRQLNFLVGANWRFVQRVDLGFAYSFTQAEGSYGGDAATPELSQIDASHEIDSDIHGLDLEVGSWLRPGMRVVAGYRLQYFREHVDEVESVASAVVPRDGRTYQHTYTLGLTLTSEFFTE